MEMLRTVLTLILILISIALVVLVLMQEGKDAGLGAIGGGGSAYDTFWSKNKGRSKEAALVKVTGFLAVAFFVLTIVLNINF